LEWGDFVMRRFKRETTSKQTVVEGEIAELVRRDVAGPSMRSSDGKAAAENINSLLQRVSSSSVQEIDRLIGELQNSRERLRLEGERVQHEIVEYATLSQSAMKATKIIVESLSRLKTAPAAPSVKDGS
jgi:hypothetical protein